MNRGLSVCLSVGPTPIFPLDLLIPFSSRTRRFHVCGALGLNFDSAAAAQFSVADRSEGDNFWEEQRAAHAAALKMKSQFFVPKNDLFPFPSSSSFFKFKQFEQFGSTGDALPPLHLSRRLVLPIMFCVFCPTMAAKTRPLRSMSSMNFTRRQFDLAEEGGREGG